MRRSLSTASLFVLAVLIAVPSRAVDFLQLLLRKPQATMITRVRAEAENEATGLEKALEWQRMQLLDEHGRYNNRGLLQANLHRQAHLPPPHPHAAPSAARLKPGSDTIYYFSWLSRGPINAGGRTRAILVHPTYSQTIYAGAASGGLWQTTDGGTNWYPLTDRWANTAISSLAFDAGNNPNIIYAGTGETYYYDAIGGVGLLKSTDGGYNWAVVSRARISCGRIPLAPAMAVCSPK